MNELTLTSNKLTMTSRDIAELTGKRHDVVKQSIQRLSTGNKVRLEPVISQPPMVDGPKSANGTIEKMFLFSGEQGKRDSIIVVAQLSPEFTARLVDRWQELELAAAKPAFVIPQTLSEALRLAADQAETIEKQQLLLEQQQPAVEFLASYVEAKSTKSLREVAKVLGQKERAFIAELESQKILFRQGSELLPFAAYQHKGYFEVKTGEANGRAYHQTKFTPKGIAWIAEKLGLTA